MSNILEEHIRPVTDKDKDLPQFSHSRLECFQNCPYQFDLKYNQLKTTSDTTIALEFGSLLHLCLEHKGLMLTQKGKVDYTYLDQLLIDGGQSDDGKGNEFHVLGLNELRSKYGVETWYEKDSEGHNYEDKVLAFRKVLQTEMQEDDGWIPTYFEQPFSYVYKDKIILHGFIDRIDTNTDGQYRVVDYKTSKKIYDEKKNATSQQFAIYNAALLLMFGAIASENLYRFICIDESQTALTTGWETRWLRKMDKVLDAIDQGYETKLWTPKPTPLCFYCNYGNGPSAKRFKHECEYFSLWTPTEKTFEKNKEWNPELQTKVKKVFDW